MNILEMKTLKTLALLLWLIFKLQSKGLISAYFINELFWRHAYPDWISK